MNEPDLEQALDGLMDATYYAEAIDEHEISKRIGSCYQDLAEAGFEYEECEQT